MLGRIIYSSGGNYRVKTKEGIFNCKPIGLFRKDNTELIVGDKVELKLNYKIGQENLNIITKLYDRKNQFIRPKISNIDFIIIVTSLVEPKFNHFYLNKMITFFQIKKIEPILIFTKIDLNKNQRNLDLIKKYEDLNYKIFNFNNSFQKKEKEKILFILKNKFSILTGQSGVGKSTVLNFLNRNLKLKTGEISFALNRGKHTTRHYEAFEIYENSLIVDSPGFSSFKLDLSLNEISKNFINFAKYYKNCQFKNCLHINEKECFVKKTADSFFYNDYLKLIKEVKENRKF
ncbi:Putative ribosome biogenesis GTPase RsgA [Candidatus Hepatoplasma crinochetorum Av]|uniref:Small ribosomal subunit biogenesis GTPase RsgA n=1 Tax=Candidatus Hepatoplasma crinochetorum Av TaxID=1427984 RepID=W8GES6_9MOLU|nr:ribosome small subunit-dependent GTPase A [Candidatus Hepatoplasma crinochetorum]AHK22294.1 Putative ribosome biogenesis GTPase RsgA [Candidatus Hepatoplasma crinochetorum Av]